MRALELACALATRPGFDDLHDPMKATPLIEAYHDPVGFPTQGYGRLLSRQRWAPLDCWPAITAETAWHWLQQDMRKAVAAVARLITVPLTDHQIAALADFAFNCGPGNLEVSTLRRVINRGDYSAAPAQFRRWVYAGPVKLPGLVRRRAAEVEFWEAS